MQSEFDKQAVFLHAARVALRVVRDVILVVDRSGRCRFANTAALHLIGQRWSSVRGRRLADVMPGQLGVALERALATAEGERRATEVNWSGVDGRAFEGRVEPAVHSAVIVLHDLAPLRAVERAAAQSDARYLTIFDHAPVGMIAYDRDHSVSDCNATFARLIRSSPERIVGLGIDELHDEQHADAVRRALAGRAITIDGPYEAASDVRLWVNATFVPVPDGAGGITGAMGFVRDRTDEMSARASARWREDRLGEAQRLARVAGWTWDAAARVHALAPDAHSTLGTRPSRCLHGPADLTTIVHPDDRESLVAHLHAIVERRVASTERELRFVRADGETRRGVLRGQWRYDAGGRLLGAWGTIQDVTETRWLEDQLRHAQKLEPVGRLAAGLAHDFNNLVMVVRANVDAAIASLPPDAPARADLAEVLQASERATELTGRLLSFARKEERRPSVVDVNGPVARVAALLRHVLRADVTLNVRLAPSVWPVLADPGQLEQVVMNLALNAIDAMPRGGTLTVTTSNVERDVTITVEDTGHGIDPAVLPRIFEPFFTTKRPGSGTGLGLSTAREIVEQSGGSVYAENVPSGGARFVVVVPRHEGADATG